MLDKPANQMTMSALNICYPKQAFWYSGSSTTHKAGTACGSSLKYLVLHFRSSSSVVHLRRQWRKARMTGPSPMQETPGTSSRLLALPVPALCVVTTCRVHRPMEDSLCLYLCLAESLPFNQSNSKTFIYAVFQDYFSGIL